MAPIKESVARCLQQLDTADRHAPVRGASTQAAKMLATPDQQISLTEPIAARGRSAAECLDQRIAERERGYIPSPAELARIRASREGRRRAKAARAADQVKSSRHKMRRMRDGEPLTPSIQTFGTTWSFCASGHSASSTAPILPI